MHAIRYMSCLVMLHVDYFADLALWMESACHHQVVMLQEVGVTGACNSWQLPSYQLVMIPKETGGRGVVTLVHQALGPVQVESKVGQVFQALAVQATWARDKWLWVNVYVHHQQYLRHHGLLVEQVFQDLADTLASWHQSPIHMVVMGDFNARLGDTPREAPQEVPPPQWWPHQPSLPPGINLAGQHLLTVSPGIPLPVFQVGVHLTRRSCPLGGPWVLADQTML